LLVNENPKNPIPESPYFTVYFLEEKETENTGVKKFNSLGLHKVN
jgi:hypothetical protein